jgi:hypothetical protein
MSQLEVALRLADMIMGIIESFRSILCNIGSEMASASGFNVVTDVVYPEHDGEYSKMQRIGGGTNCKQYAMIGSNLKVTRPSEIRSSDGEESTQEVSRTQNWMTFS